MTELRLNAFYVELRYHQVNDWEPLNLGIVEATKVTGRELDLTLGGIIATDMLEVKLLSRNEDFKIQTFILYRK